jgi:hypothetical protein
MASDFLDQLIDSPDATENAPRMAIIAVLAPAANSVELTIRGKCGAEIATLGLSPPFVREDGQLEDRGEFPPHLKTAKDAAAYVAEKVHRVEKRYAKALSIARSLEPTADMETFTRSWKKGLRK